MVSCLTTYLGIFANYSGQSSTKLIPGIMGDSVRIPVIVSKRRINFAHSEFTPQMFTLYNPYEYSIKYRVLGTSTTSYEVGSHSGTIDPNCCKDLTVRCKAALAVGNTDKLRIEISHKDRPQMSGSKEIELVTVQRTTETTRRNNTQDSSSAGNHPIDPRVGDPQELNQVPYLVVGLLCALALIMPTVSDPYAETSNVPEYFHLTMPQKLVAAYILGIVSILILRPN